MCPNSGKSREGPGRQSNQASRQPGSGSPKTRDHVKSGYVQKSIRKRERPVPRSLGLIAMIEVRRLYKRLRTEKLKRDLLSLVTKAHTGLERAQISRLLRQGRDLWVEHGAERFEQEMGKCIQKATDKKRTDEMDVQLTKSFHEMQVEDADRASVSLAPIQPFENVDMADVPDSAEDGIDTNEMSEG